MAKREPENVKAALAPEGAEAVVKSNGVVVVTYPDPKEVRDPAKPAKKEKEAEDAG